MKLLTRLRKLVGRAVRDYAMIEAGDRIAVGVSGGKDSYTLLEVLRELSRRSPVPFEVQALLVDQGFMGFDVETIEAYLDSRGIPLEVHATDTQAAEEDFGVPGGAFCAFCASHRRGLLYKAARRLGCNKLALGHHMDDVVETLLMNMFFNGKIRGMPARLAATGQGRGMELIRPLVYVPEELVIAFAREQAYPLVLCGCPTCGTGLQKRQRIKQLLGSLEQETPGLKKSLLQSMRNVEAQQLLLDPGSRRALGELLLRGAPPEGGTLGEGATLGADPAGDGPEGESAPDPDRELGDTLRERLEV